MKARNATAGRISDARLEDVKTLSAAYVPPSELAPNLIKISTNGHVSDTIRAVHAASSREAVGDNGMARIISAEHSSRAIQHSNGLQ